MSKLPSSAYSGLTEKEMIEISYEVYNSDIKDMIDLCEIGELDDETFNNLWAAITANRDYILEHGTEKDKEKLLDKPIKSADINFELPEVTETEEPKYVWLRENLSEYSIQEERFRNTVEGEWIIHDGTNTLSTAQPYTIDHTPPHLNVNFDFQDRENRIANIIRSSFGVPSSYFVTGIDEAQENNEEEEN